MILYGIWYSPWSLRARWALHHHGIDHEYREYVPMITTPVLRARLGDIRGKITVPVYFTPDAALRDSTEIARWADEAGGGATLFAGASEEVATWIEVAEAIAEGGRVISTFDVLNDPEAVQDNVPPFIPKALRGASTPLVSLGAHYLQRKYGFDRNDKESAEQQMRAALESVGNHLQGRETLGDKFGWSDIVVASALQFVRPHDTWVRFRRSSRRCWTRHELSADFEDVLRWRDRLLAAHPSATASRRR